MLGQGADVLQHFLACVLRSGLGCHLGVLDCQPNLFRELRGCRLELHEVMTLGCCRGLRLLVEHKVLLPKQHFVSFALACGVTLRVLMVELHLCDNPIQAVELVTD